MNYGKMIHAPFSEEQVEGLKYFQGNMSIRESYVCEKCFHVEYTYGSPIVIHINLDVTKECLVCPKCGYKEYDAYEMHTILPYKYEGVMRDGMDCPKCLHDGKTGDEIGKFKDRSSPFETIHKFSCTKCFFSQTAYDVISATLGVF